MVCYCDDCQAFAHQLDRADLLDPHGGSDIVQVAPASLSFESGSDRIVALRLGPKGIYRWYADCCKTPMGNTVKPAIPFVGLCAKVFEYGGVRADDVFGKPIAGFQGRFAIPPAPAGSTGLNLRLLARAVRMVVGWKVTGKTWPHPFFDRGSATPNRPVKVLSRAERDALRAKCGPHPAAAAAPTNGESPQADRGAAT